MVFDKECYKQKKFCTSYAVRTSLEKLREVTHPGKNDDRRQIVDPVPVFMTRTDVRTDESELKNEKPRQKRDFELKFS